MWNREMIEKPAVGVDAVVGGALAGVGHEILADARGTLDDPAQSQAEAVHGYRKTMKRWRALLRLLEPFLGEDGARLQQEARDLARELAGARDFQAALDALADVANAETGLSPTSFASMRHRIETNRTAAEAIALTDTMRARLSAAVEGAARAVAAWPLGHIGFPQIASELARTYRQARRAIPKDWAAATGEDIHDLRKRVVAHRYQMEFIEPLWPRLTKVWVSEAQRLRDQLGAHHDLETLKGLTASRQPLAPWRSRLLPAIAARQQVHVTAARRLSGRLFAERPAAFRKRLVALWTHRADEDDWTPAHDDAPPAT